MIFGFLILKLYFLIVKTLCYWLLLVLFNVSLSISGIKLQIKSEYLQGDSPKIKIKINEMKLFLL